MMFRVYSALLFLFVVASTLGTASAQAKCRDGVTFTSLDTGRTLTRIITSESQCEFVCDFAESFPDDVDYSFKWEMSDETYDGACVCATPNCGPGVYETSSGCVCNPDGATCTMCTAAFRSCNNIEINNGNFINVEGENRCANACAPDFSSWTEGPTFSTCSCLPTQSPSEVLCIYVYPTPEPTSSPTMKPTPMPTASPVASTTAGQSNVVGGPENSTGPTSSAGTITSWNMLVSVLNVIMSMAAVGVASM